MHKVRARRDENITMTRLALRRLDAAPGLLEGVRGLFVLRLDGGRLPIVSKHRVAEMPHRALAACPSHLPPSKYLDGTVHAVPRLAVSHFM